MLHGDALAVIEILVIESGIDRHLVAVVEVAVFPVIAGGIEITCVAIERDGEVAAIVNAQRPVANWRSCLIFAGEVVDRAVGRVAPAVGTGQADAGDAHSAALRSDAGVWAAELGGRRSTGKDNQCQYE